MNDKMIRFLNSIGIENVDRFDLDFDLVTRNTYNRNQIDMLIVKQTPWNFELLEEVTEKLQSDDLPLEEAFENYKKGMDLIKKCSAQIDMVEKEVLKLGSDMELEKIE